MKESYWGYWLILLGVFVVAVMLLIQSTTTGNTQDYLMVKEVTQASMIDAVDFAYYRVYGEVKMNKEKFVENFIRRFAENVNITANYNIDFFDLYEVPPKVTVRVSTNSNAINVANSTQSFDVVNDISAILEFGYSNTNTSGTNISKYSCKLHMKTEMVNELKKLYPDENITNLSTAKEVFDRKYNGYATMSVEQMKASWPEFGDWFSKGYLTISK